MQLFDALGVGRGLRLQIGDVLGRVAGRVGALGEERKHRFLAEAAAFDQLERVDIDALFLDARRLRAHRARGNAADIGMVPARGDEKQDLGAVLGEDRRHHGDVGEMGAAIIGRVQHPYIAGSELRSNLAHHRGDAPVHGAEMHRDVRRIGDELPVAIEDGAGEVEPLLDVDRARRVLEGAAHLLGDRREALVEHLEQNRVGAGVEREPGIPPLGAGEQEMVLGGDLGLPAGFDHHRLMRFDDQRGAFEAMSGTKVLAAEHGRLVPGAAGEERGRGVSHRRPLGGKREIGLGGVGTAAQGLDLDGFDLDGLVGTDKAEALPVQVLKA